MVCVVSVGIMSMCVMSMRVLGWANIFHLVDTSTLRAALDWAVLGHLEGDLISWKY